MSTFTFTFINTTGRPYTTGTERFQ